MNWINPSLQKEDVIKALRKSFEHAQPYKHLVMDNFLDSEIAQALYDHFPSTSTLSKHYNGLNEKKSEGANFKDFHPVFSELKSYLMSAQLSEWISKITGIEKVFVTDDQLGTGLHQGSNGSFLDIHIDFNIHTEKNVHRRLNLLIYLNQDWNERYGGDLELWNADMSQCIKKVAPEFNRCVLFETSEISYHGYSKVHLPQGQTRKSVYTYFYTQERENASSYHDTVFKAKPDDSTLKKLGTPIKEKIKNFAKTQLRKIGIKL